MIQNEVLTQPLDYGTSQIEEVRRVTYVSGRNADTKSEILILESYSNGKSTKNTWIESFLSQGKEDLYVRFIKNLYKKIDFMELAQSLESGEITEDEFDSELDQNEEQYLIPCPEQEPTQQQVIQAADIIKRINRVQKMSVDEASELFSLNLESGMKLLAPSENQIAQ